MECEFVNRGEVQELVEFGAGHTGEGLRDDAQSFVLEGLELVVVVANSEL